MTGTRGQANDVLTHHATAVQRNTLNGKADLMRDVFKLVKVDLEQNDSD